ncbi:MAG: hypothetical protein NT096_01545 [Proteobacteria bacterium]|nr:hypothetical protein [Pseudomonadota bacterium]
MLNNTGWKIDFFDEETKTEYNTYFETYPKQKHVKISFEKDVTKNPFFHSTPRRIVSLKGKLKGKYRYGKSETRIIYEPDQVSKTVFPLETAKITDVSYKRKSKKK